MDSIAKNSKIAIFSTNIFAKTLKDVILKYRPDLKIVYFIDSFNQSDVFCDVPVIRPNQIPDFIDCVIVASKSHREELVSVLKSNNWNKYITLSDLYFDTILKYFEYSHMFRFVQPGHYYSTIPTEDTVSSVLTNLDFDVEKEYRAIDFNIQKQLEYLDHFNYVNNLYVFPELPSDNFYYYSKNTFFGKCDALSLLNIILKNRPKRIIEVGSGYSTALMTDINKLYFDNSIKISSIEPYPDRLRLLFKDEYEKLDLQVVNLQEIPVDYFEQLGENDLLFIDSSHVSKTGSDVNYLMFEILPRLKKNVIVHFHDIFFPFEYPKPWYEQGRYWNEIYMMKAFLSYNNAFKILFWNNYMTQYVNQKNIKTNLVNNGHFGGSLYLRKIID